MRTRSVIGKLRALLALSALMLLPTSAFSVELFEGNLGYNGDWLHVMDAPAMGNRIYWYDLGDDVTYQVQCATDPTFSSLALEESGVVTNYVEPSLGPDFYHFRVREVHSSGAMGSWSPTGTLHIVEDIEWPRAEILSPLSNQTFESGATVSIELKVSDDTVLHLARFTINGEYAGTLGLKAENHKIRPSFGEPRTVVFDYQVPTTGKTGPLEISVIVYDVTYKAVTTSVVVNGGSSSSTQKANNKGGGRKK